MSVSRSALVAALVASCISVAVGAATIALADDDPRANDVASGSVFHDDIGDFLDAGCATGFPGGTYRPTNPVLRQQMARFIHACGGRVAFAEQTLFNMNTTFQDAATVTLEAGALGSGGGFALVIGAVEARLTGGTPPCEVSATLVQTGGTEAVSDSIRVNIFETGESDEATGTLMDLVPLAAGEQIQVSIRSRVDNGPNCSGATIATDFKLTALYIPFGGDGGGGGA